MTDKKSTLGHSQKEPADRTSADLEHEFGFISEELSKLPYRPRFRGGKEAWTELEEWLRLEGLLR